MREYSLIAPAKINLFLGIVGHHFSRETPPKPDGFHELVMVMQTVDLADRVTVRETSRRGITVTCDDGAVPQDETNLAYKAAALMQQNFPDAAARHGGVAILLEKKIPMGAGLAGGSADCAAVLVGIDLLWDLGLTQAELQGIAAQIGSDIPFCVSGGTALATGRGELIDPLPDLDNLYVVLAKYRDLPVSTPWAYQAFRQRFGATYPLTPAETEAKKQVLRSGEMLSAINQRQAQRIAQLLHNDLEKVVLPEYPQIQGLRDTFAALPVMGTMMSGSGSTVFALCDSEAKANAVRSQMQQQIDDVTLDLWVTKFCASGVHLA
ncbi:4-(cytidine 5'-diphospho)-2-C-methyl-D-erythritol kinase [filamentous cyanobacterium LEGE 11480]|uniref:4-diphosphocytidyl-2-C-methyl-D-erythritol kinase n=1 Tax=Romeriopsis navalis LEGE 11480 TaxID=2777977 RepID=A0A928VQ73_9CYAN|nr:4-(cytidine 5'-diphospho)-2-C-methyl-D-erythritol kinase [Romeriopsis navalis]MBE9031778.1 4-(cytidine 5'-diphospho)-2-C-methyl-D-erythritol kinase [Romeriopsis navalis LEGE 11480]